MVEQLAVRGEIPERMSNFTFLDSEFPKLGEAAKRSELQIFPDARASCFHARFALEAAVHWLYKFDKRLQSPYDKNLGALLHEPSFKKVVPEAIFHKARVIHQVGNQAVHNQRPIRQLDALQVVKELHHFLYWLGRTYAKQGPGSIGKQEWDGRVVPRPHLEQATISRDKLAELETELEKKNRESLERQEKIDALDVELKKVRDLLAVVVEANEETPDEHDYSEAETRKYLIDVDLKRAGWPLDGPNDKEYKVTGMPNATGEGFADYVLWGDDGLPLAVIEAKRASEAPEKGKRQAELYAKCLEQMHGQRPVIFYTNGYETWIWDDAFYPARRVAGYYSKGDLTRIVQRRTIRKPLDVAMVDEDIAGRYYQKRAIGSIAASFAAYQRKGLLVMATGTGKTRTSIALVDVLQKANWAKRVLFLADRISLVNQAANAFKEHLPDSSPVNLVTEKDKEGRVYVCTYPTMMGLIDQTKGNQARFGVGYFDLIIVDEAHRSIYQRYKDIFRYFDSLLIGLTATPREQVDRNTYDLFDLEPGVPTDAYELEQAVSDEFLVPPKVSQVDMKFPQEGITYDKLSEEDREQWESLDWGDDAEENPIPRAVNASAINNWLFNKSTVDKALQVLMEKGHKVAGGDRLGKTIVFARNHDHAIFIEERFNRHYPHYKGQFARVIDNYAKYPQSLIDDFSIKEKDPQIAISVDMLDTGIDVPEVLNLVFFKPVYSKIKFWQMIGRGTRLCPGLFPEAEKEEDRAKQNFRIFDFCFNFDFFKENPDGIEGSGGTSLSTRLFQSRLKLISHLQTTADLEATGKLRTGLSEILHDEVAGMNIENFIVRMRLETVERFQKIEAWKELSEDDAHDLSTEVAGLPSEIETDDMEARMFDLTALQMQLGHVEGNRSVLERLRKKVIEIAGLLEEKDAIPAVKEQLAYLQAVQTPEFWEGIDLALLEELRTRMRGLVQFLDRKKRTVIYSDFPDEVVKIREGEPISIPKMTGAQYEKKVRAFLQSSKDHITIQKLRQNEPLTAVDLEEMERLMLEIGEEEGAALLSGLLAKSEAPSVPHFVRTLVGMDRTAAQKAFSMFLKDRSLLPHQIRFTELIIDQLTARGVMEPGSLYEPPFSDLDAGGPDAIFAGNEKIIDGLFTTLREAQSNIEEAS